MEHYSYWTFIQVPVYVQYIGQNKVINSLWQRHKDLKHFPELNKNSAHNVQYIILGLKQIIHNICFKIKIKRVKSNINKGLLEKDLANNSHLWTH